MLKPISHATWQTLRIIARCRDGAVVGRELRNAPTRRTHDGSFLADLVAEGLIRVVSGRDDERPWDVLYALTDLGKHAAEYGEYSAEVRQTASRLNGRGRKAVHHG